MEKTASGPPPPERSGPQKLGLNVWTARKRVEKLRYMHRNPVQRGLVASPELWRWSSFRAYLFGEAGPVAVNKWDVLKIEDTSARRLRAKSIVARGADRPLLENREKWRTPYKTKSKAPLSRVGLFTLRFSCFVLPDD
jgi:hypothetical protein